MRNHRLERARAELSQLPLIPLVEQPQFPHPAGSGVYFLYYHGQDPRVRWYPPGKPIYIGQGKSARHRLKVHRTTLACTPGLPPRDFQCKVLETPWYMDLERMFLDLYKPWWDVQFLPGFGNDRSRRQNGEAAAWENVFQPSNLMSKVSLRWHTPQEIQQALEDSIAAYEEANTRPERDTFVKMGVWNPDPVGPTRGDGDILAMFATEPPERGEPVDLVSLFSSEIP